MKRRLFAIALGVCLIVPAAFLKAEEQERSVSGFDQVSMSIPADLEISQGSSEGLILIGSSADLEKIITEVKDGHLKIEKKKGSGNIKDVTIKLSVKNLEELSIAGSGDVVFKTDFKSNEFEVNISGSGDLVCDNISASEVELNIAGSGDVKMGGVLNSELEVNIAGSGDVDAANLKAREVEVNIAGSGDARVWAEEELEASIVGSGNVYYKGRPLVDAEATGSGSTKPL